METHEHSRSSVLYRRVDKSFLKAQTLLISPELSEIKAQIETCY